MLNHPSYQYLIDVIEKRVDAPRYVVKECKRVRGIYEDRDDKYTINTDKVEIIDGLLRLLIMPTGVKVGQTIYESLVGFQFFLLVTTLCTVYRDDPTKRRYTKMVLEICRKNAKTFIIALIFILLLFIEPQYSQFYSAAPDGETSRLIKQMMERIIKSSPHVSDKFKIKRDEIICKVTDSEYVPLNYKIHGFDGKLPTAFVADEVGMLPNNTAIEGLQSGQLTIQNKLGCIISTKYSKVNNPFEEEVNYSKKVIDGLIEDEEIFSLLYEPDDTANWETNDMIIRHGNPLAMEIPEIMEDIIKLRKRAIEKPSARENFVTKHCNIMYSGTGTETYIPVEKIQRGRIEEFDWEGRNVYLGLDLAMTTDNCSMAMLTYTDDGELVAKAIAFIPTGRIEEKTTLEKVDYDLYSELEYCIPCGDEVIDYNFIEEVILDIEKEYGVKVIKIGYDRYNAISTAQKLIKEGYEAIEVKQHSSILHRPTKWLEELVLEKKFYYIENKLLEINFHNAKCTYDTNLNRYVNKKKSTGKIDMVVSILFALCLLQLDIDEQVTWGVQVI